MSRARSLILGLSALGMTAAGYAADIRPGLWEFRSTRMNIAGLPDLSSQMAQLQQHLKSLPPDMRRMVEQQMTERGVTLGRDGAVRSCISPEQAKQDNIYSGKTEGNCTLGNVTKTGDRVTGRLTCTQPQATGDFAARVSSPEHFTTRVNMKSAHGDMQMETEARWLSAQCEAPQRGLPQAAR